MEKFALLQDRVAVLENCHACDETLPDELSAWFQEKGEPCSSLELHDVAHQAICVSYVRGRRCFGQTGG
jgi:hypothetical protein